MSKAETKWIPVSERNPEKTGRYLVACEGIRGTVIRVYKDGWSSLQEVTHWMPLPKPPKERAR